MLYSSRFSRIFSQADRCKLNTTNLYILNPMSYYLDQIWVIYLLFRAQTAINLRVLANLISILYSWFNENYWKTTFCHIIPHFLKVCVMPLCFYKRPTFVPVLTIERNIKMIFVFIKKKGKKWKEHSAFVFQKAKPL